MNAFLWLMQGVLAIKLFTAAYQHGLRQDLSTMQEAISRMGESSRYILYSGASFSFLVGVAIIVPGLINWKSNLTPAAALGSALLMTTGMVFHHISRHDPKLYVSLVLLVISAFVAYGRWQLAPL